MPPFWLYDQDGTRHEDITDWALEHFRKQYPAGRANAKRPMTKDAIFHYIYGVLHDPVYREKYALNLKREFLGFRSIQTSGPGRPGARS